MRDHRKLRAFELADELTLLIYKATLGFPKEERYGLTSQMRRSSLSVASNIVEGCARDSQTEYVRFPEIGYGSLKELHYQFSITDRLGYFENLNIDKSEFESKFVELEKVLGSLIKVLRDARSKLFIFFIFFSL